MSSPISGFTAIPNPQMLAFMPIQSYLMMYFAGAGWQIGKRKISAIPNDQFNKMSANDLLKGFTADLRETIPTLERSLNDITPLIRTLIEQYGDFIKIAIATIPQVAKETFTDVVTGAPGFEGSAADRLLKSFGSNPTQAQFLAYAKILLQQHLAKQNKGTITSPSGFKIPIIQKSPFQGPGINTLTGEQSVASKKALEDQAVLDKAKPQVHVKPRKVSNVSLQSLLIEKSRLTQEYSRQKAIYDRIPSKNFVQRSAQWKKVKQAELNYANFFKMHGSRFS